MNGLGMYAEVSQNSEVMGASEHRRIQMLFEKALIDLQTAANAIAEKDVITKCKAIGSANNIVCYLRDILRADVDPAGVARIDALYRHVEQALFLVNARNDAEGLQECVTIIENMKAWWDHVGA
ncbi:Flagellar protein FliS [Legionella geestiana]|uniref:Flagellar protein FliS n=1 Tax=Legionella geestiana TaxID=45065 RepID=A0A0W0TXI4_9GAMM|nr:flagellar export chaperone FliS [Legionella geestiana]KTD00119.1 Flagellar protein FliS [Legionella geestiana]QBS11835.1 flagellar protein FliS [Legionella geestiana]QDQ40550.1 flagellar protein FliS [Legionella geestiana]STX53470.1 Flagellar protein fliS [Legionella geestiana]